MSALTVRPEDEVTPGEPAAIVHSKAFDPTGKVHQWGIVELGQGAKE